MKLSPHWHVTFVIPTIGRPTLVRSLESLAAQTDSAWDAIIVADGPMAIRSYDSRIRIIYNEETNSAGLTRNAGIDKCVGPWVAFLDDDDTVHPRYVEWLKEAASCDERPDVVVFRMDHPQLGILPDPEEPRLEYGRVGISYAVRLPWLLEHKFVREDLANPGLHGNEDICLLTELINDGAKVAVWPDVAYYVRSEPRG